MTDDPVLWDIVPRPPPGHPAYDYNRTESIASAPRSDEQLRKFFDAETVERDLANQLAQATEVTKRVANIGTHLMDMTEALTVRADKQRRLDAKRKADQERRAQEEAACAEAAEHRKYLAEHPDPNAPADDTHHPSGELHSLDPVDKEHFDPEASEDDQGDLPNELEEGAPPPLGSYPVEDPKDLGKSQNPRSVPQPASTSLW
jgi:hypothetical protein